jgi:L-ascorbate metabolism protein UlaG (beta-lactamase superfamily)
MTSGARRRIDDTVAFRVEYADHTSHGSAITGLTDALVHRTCAPACAELPAVDDPDFGSHARDVLARCFAPTALGALYTAPGRLRAACRYPDPSRALPVALRVGRDQEGAATMRRIPVERAAWPDVAAWLAEWRERSVPPRGAAAGRLWEALTEVDGLTGAPPPGQRCDEGLTMIGHATVRLRAADTTLLVDPFLLGTTRGASTDYRPHTRAELAADAVLVTHSHPDHFDVGSLLGLGRDVEIYVPKVDRESLLAIDMQARLVELGFSRVHALAWGDRVQIGGLTVYACPFYGEQPTDGDVLHPEIRNVGCTYLVDDGRRRVWFLADAGRDGLGASIDAIPDAAKDGRGVDVVCGGYRAWRLHPVQYVTTSVARYLLFVPPEQWERRMQLMNDAHDLAALASRVGARWVVPYANGGAPWYWRHGLGPDLRTLASAGSADFDPDHGALASAAADPSTPTLVTLHPGEHMHWLADGSVCRVAAPGFVWPFAEPQPQLRARVPTRSEANA